MEILAKLAVNLAVVGLFLSLWVQLSQILARHRRSIRDPIFGIMVGAATIASMLVSVPLQDGVFFDLRNSLLAIAAFFGGPAALVPSIVLAGCYRLWVGGLGMVPGLMTMALASLAGLAGYVWSARRPQPLHIAVVAIASGLVIPLGLFALPVHIAEQALVTFAIPFTVVTIILTGLGSLLIVQTGKAVRLRDLLYAALVQAPDFQYVKDSKGRFVAVNENVVRHHGRQNVSDLVGLSDADLENPSRAAELASLEVAVLERGEPLLNFEENVGQAGVERWFKSSKVALRDYDGAIIGLSGVTRDITEQKQLEAELRRSRDTLAFVTAQMSDGLAMFDRNGNLLFCNERYRLAFPLTTALRKPGANLRDILQAVVDTGEQVNLPGATPDAWIENVMASLGKDSEEQIELYDGRWLYCRTRAAEDGAALVVVSDISTIKRSEQELQTLATTDGLTGLYNRRSFDTALGRALARAAETGRPLSLLMIDVDRFKSYNDHYGHPAGDECLRVIAGCLRATLRRADDVVARYGGEEFVAILPDTDEDTAFTVAERFRTNVVALQIPNQARGDEVVTVSLGICCTNSSPEPWTSANLVSRSDEALYEAKGAGRNRVNGWRESRLSRSAEARG